MEAKELRIGNLMQDQDGNILRVSFLTDADAPNIGCYVLDRTKFPLRDVFKTEPIPLTKEWLVKFGFILDYDESFKWYDKGKISISFKQDRMVEKLRNSYNQYKIPQHVHQLQNLFYALTGEELTIK